VELAFHDDSPELEGIARAWTRGQARIAIPTLAAFVAVFAWAGYPRWRLAVLLLSQPTLILVRRLLVHRSLAQRIFIGWTTLVLSNATMVAVSGGLASPLLPTFVGPPMGAMVTYGRSRRGLVLLALVFACTAALALLPPSARGPSLPAHARNVVYALATLFTFVMARNGLTAVAEAHQRSRDELARMREAVLAETRARVRSLETMGARVGHELKNPLTALKGLLPLLARDAQDERSRARFDVVTNEVARMEETVRGYLSFSRPLDDLQLAPVALGAVVADVFAVLEGRAANAGVRLERDGDAPPIEGDAHRLRDAVLNLVTNALDASPAGSRIRVTLGTDGDGVALTIQDHGAGMPADVLARLGRPFFSTKGQGTGLGVVLARASVEQHGGTLGFVSEVGRGTTATVKLPARVPEALRRKPLSVA
jgi:signal transduction histidine kinase